MSPKNTIVRKQGRKIPPPSEFARFRFFDQHSLPRLPVRLIESSQEVARQIEQKPPRLIQEVILNVTPNMINRSGSLEVFIYGPFRSHFQAIDRFADYLIPFYLQIGILPMIRPLTKPEWMSHYQNKGSAWSRIVKNGWLLSRVG